MCCQGMRRRSNKGRMANGEWRIGMRVERTSDQFLSGPAGLAGRHGIGGALLPVDESVSARRAVRNVVADQALGVVYSSQYRGRTRARKHAVVRPVPSHRPRIAQGIGNALAARRKGWAAQRQADRNTDGPMHKARKEAAITHSLAATEGIETVVSPSIRHSPFAIRQLP